MFKSIRYFFFLGMTLFLLMQLLTRCIDPVDLNTVGSDQLLVVEGFLSDEAKAHQVSLSLSVPLDDTTNVIPEIGAEVRIVDSQGNTFNLAESSPGIYLTAPNVSGIVGEQYTLMINTRDGRAFSSDPVTLKRTPPIDSIYGRFLRNQPNQENGISIFVDTHDPSGQVRAFRWEYEETHQIQAAFPSELVWLGGSNYPEDFMFREEQVGTCWDTQSSQNILIRSTQNLESPRISEFRIRFLPEDSRLMQKRYSILVKQYALDENAFRFWQTLRDLSESQGTLFDIQPGVVTGNIRSLNSNNETVLGYFDAAQVSELREFFEPNDFFFDGFSPFSPIPACEEELDTVFIGNVFEVLEAREGFVEIYQVTGVAPGLFFLIVTNRCGNCTNQGTNVQPDFWE